MCHLVPLQVQPNMNCRHQLLFMNDAEDRSTTAAFHFLYRRMQMRKLSHVTKYRHQWYHELIWRRCGVLFQKTYEWYYSSHAVEDMLYGSKWKCNEFLQAVAITQFKYQIAVVSIFIIGISFLNSLTVHFSLSAWCLLVALRPESTHLQVFLIPCIVIASRPHWSPIDKSDLVEPCVTFINESGWSAVISMPSAMNDY